jgi:predicted nucleic acid-binding protein
MDLSDTNVVSELFKRAPNPGVLNWARSGGRVLLSAVSVDELWLGLMRIPRDPRRERLELFLAERGDVLPITQEIARAAGVMRGLFAARGIVRSQADMLIAATAQLHQLTLVTRNTRDFEGCAIPILNPFS